jgi:hypothetical protein
LPHHTDAGACLLYAHCCNAPAPVPAPPPTRGPPSSPRATPKQGQEPQQPPDSKPPAKRRGVIEGWYAGENKGYVLEEGACGGVHVCVVRGGGPRGGRVCVRSWDAVGTLPGGQGAQPLLSHDMSCTHLTCGATTGGHRRHFLTQAQYQGAGIPILVSGSVNHPLAVQPVIPLASSITHPIVPH